MSEPNATEDIALLTHARLLEAGADARAQLVEGYLMASIRTLHGGSSGDIDATSHLADLAIDSLQVVELKFGLDQVIGRELDVELIMSNPTVHELATNSVRAGSL